MYIYGKGIVYIWDKFLSKLYILVSLFRKTATPLYYSLTFKL